MGKEPGSPPGGPKKPLVVGLILGAVAIAVVIGALYLRSKQLTAPPSSGDSGVALAPPPAPDAQAAADEPIEPEVDPGTGAPLSADQVLRRLATRGSSSPELASWLSAEGVLRRIAAAALLISQGRSPRNMLGFIQIADPFKVIDTLVESKGKGEDRILIAPESYARYDVLARVVKGADVAEWGRGYRRLRPHLNAAFAEVAEPGQRFDDVLAAAITRLLAARVPEGPIELVEKGALFLFADPALESLSDAEKHMIRLGPANAAVIQEGLRVFARNAGLRVE